jgi:opacity protein-like surface antigen
MKKLLISSVLLFSIMQSANAQGLYFGLMPGYGFAAGRTTLRADYYSSFSSTGSVTQFTSISSSFGKGFTIGVYGGYMFSKNIGAELGLSYLMSSPIELSSSRVNAANTVTTESTSKLEAGAFRIIPALRLSTSGDGKLQAYMKVGLILGVSTKLVDSETSTTINKSTKSISETSEEYKGPMALGFHGACGVMYKLSDMLGIFAELGGNLQNWGPTSSAKTIYNVDGVDVLAGMTTSQKESEYLESYSTNIAQSNGEPSRYPRMYYPFSSVSISLGVHITLGKSE